LIPASGSAEIAANRPVHQFSLCCAFNRQRGQVIVLAGARAGACAVVTAAALALGTFGYVRSALFGGGPRPAAAAIMPPLASAANALALAKGPSTQPSHKASSCARVTKSAKSAKVVKIESPVVSSTPAAIPTIRHHQPADEREAEGRRAGLDYLVVVNNLRTKATAERLREALLRKGVATTVERDLPGESDRGKYSLVCLTGFNPDSEKAKLDKQVKRLKALKLDPKPYTWGG
jgi:hypothetical protein